MERMVGGGPQSSRRSGAEPDAPGQQRLVIVRRRSRGQRGEEGLEGSLIVWVAVLALALKLALLTIVALTAMLGYSDFKRPRPPVAIDRALAQLWSLEQIADINTLMPSLCARA